MHLSIAQTGTCAYGGPLLKCSVFFSDYSIKISVSKKKKKSVSIGELLFLEQVLEKQAVQLPGFRVSGFVFVITLFLENSYQRCSC